MRSRGAACGQRVVSWTLQDRKGRAASNSAMIKRGGILLICCFVVPLAWATSVVAKVEKNRIILAADTRRKALSSGAANSRDFHDDYCKISALPKVGFAAAGYSDHTEKNDAGGVIWSWSASEDAQASYRLHLNNITEMADDWRTREVEIFSTLYVLHENLVKELAGADGKTPLVIGHFVGWDSEGRPTLILESIVLYQGPFSLSNLAIAPPSSVLAPIVGYRTVLLERDLPYSTNNYTESLIEGDPALSSPVAKKWSEGAKRLSESERDWRWVEFLIRRTADHDEAVGKCVAVLEIQPSGTTWLQPQVCRPKKTTRASRKRQP